MTNVEYKEGNIEFNICNLGSSYLFDSLFSLKDGSNVLYSDLYNCSLTSDTGVSHYAFPFATIRLITKFLQKSSIQFDTSNLVHSVGTPQFEDLGQDFLRDEQYSFIKKVMTKFQGILQLPTGYGKNTMMVYLIKASLVREGNILITAPSYSIVNEISERCSKYGITVNSDFDTTSKIWAINPKGMINSNRVNNPEICSWLENVTTIFMDECQEINASQQTLMEKFLYKCKYRYGFSATADKFTGLDLTTLEDLSSVNPETFKIMQYFGPAIVYKPPQRKVRVVETPIYFGDYKNFYSFDRCVGQVANSDKMMKYYRQCIQDNNRVKRSTIFVPFTNRNHVMKAMSDPLLKDFHLIMWTADSIKHNNGIEDEHGDLLNKMKVYINNHLVDLVFASSVAFKGVDFTELKSVLFITTSSFGLVTQILGRIFRYAGDDYPTVYLPKNLSNNPLFNSSYNKRREQILKNDHILEVMPFKPYC